MKKFIISILDLFSWGQFKEIWKWAKIDGFDVDESDWLPDGYSPSDLVTRRGWDYIKSVMDFVRQEKQKSYDQGYKDGIVKWFKTEKIYNKSKLK